MIPLWQTHKTTQEGSTWTAFNRWYYKGKTWEQTRTGQTEKRLREWEEMQPIMKEAERLLTEAKGSRTWKQLCDETGCHYYGTFRKWKERYSLCYLPDIERMLMTLGIRITWKAPFTLAQAFQWETEYRKTNKKTPSE